MISVIIPTYNYAEYLLQAVDSVLAQTYHDFEIIIVNDGSTDNTSQVIQEYLSNPCIRYIEKANEGQTKTKNRGISEAKGDFIAFLDADDIWMPDKLEKQMVLFDDPDVGVVFSDFVQIDETNAGIHHFDNLPMFRGKVTEQLFMDNFVCFPSSIVRKTCFDAMGPFDESLDMGIDWDLWLRLSTRYKFDYIDEPLVKYRVGHAGQMSKNKEKRFACAERIMRKFEENFPNLISKKIHKKAWCFTWQNRAAYYMRHDKKKKAMVYLAQAFVQKLINIRNYKLFFKMLVT